jgi:4-hydroxy-tetrahydrodipicolinate synthase
MIAALKAAVAHFSGDPAWTTVRPPLVALATEQQRLLLDALQALGFAMPGLRAGNFGARPVPITP